MKKFLTKFLCIILAACACLSLAACKRIRHDADDPSNAIIVKLDLHVESDGKNVSAVVKNSFTLFPATAKVKVYLYYSESEPTDYTQMNVVASNQTKDLDLNQSLTATAEGKTGYYVARMQYRLDSRDWAEKTTDVYDVTMDKYGARGLPDFLSSQIASQSKLYFFGNGSAIEDEEVIAKIAACFYGAELFAVDEGYKSIFDIDGLNYYTDRVTTIFAGETHIYIIDDGRFEVGYGDKNTVYYGNISEENIEALADLVYEFFGFFICNIYLRNSVFYPYIDDFIDEIAYLEHRKGMGELLNTSAVYLDKNPYPYSDIPSMSEIMLSNDAWCVSAKTSQVYTTDSEYIAKWAELLKDVKFSQILYVPENVEPEGDEQEDDDPFVTKIIIFPTSRLKSPATRVSISSCRYDRSIFGDDAPTDTEHEFKCEVYIDGSVTLTFKRDGETYHFMSEEGAVDFETFKNMSIEFYYNEEGYIIYKDTWCMILNTYDYEYCKETDEEVK